MKSITLNGHDGRELTITVNKENGLCSIVETIDNERITVTTSTKEISLISNFIEHLQKEVTIVS